LLRQTEGRDFVMVLSVHTESLRVSVKPEPVWIRLL
jgi:hypothetical protein